MYCAGSRQQASHQRVWLPAAHGRLTATDSVCHGRLTTDSVCHGRLTTGSVCHGRLTTDEW